MKKSKVVSFLKDYKSLPILILFIIMAVTLTNGKSLSAANIQNLMTQVSIQGIVGLGMTFALLCAEFDLAVGSIYTCSGILFAQCLQVMGFFPALLITLLLGVVLGFCDGFVVNKMKIPAFVGTLGTSYIYKGMAKIMSDGQPISVSNNKVVIALSNANILGFSVFPYIFFSVTVICVYVLKRTRFGRNIYATGGNYEVAKNSGINVDFYKIMSFVICGVSSALAGVLLAVRLQSATPIAGDDLNLVVIGAVIIGGTRTDGGIGSAQKSLIGLLIFGVLINTMDVLGIAGYYQQVVRGIMTVAVIGGTSYVTYRKTSSL